MGHLKKTGLQFVELVAEALDGIIGNDWSTNLIGIVTDGANDMLGAHKGFSTLLRQRCSTSHGVVTNWCTAHQLNLSIGVFLAHLDEFLDFRPALRELIKKTRKEISSTRPGYTPNRWQSIYTVCEYMQKHFDDIVEFYSDFSWWYCLCLVAEMAKKIHATFATLQYRHATTQQHQQVLDDFRGWLQSRFAMNNSEEVEISRAKVSPELMSANKTMFSNIHNPDVKIKLLHSVSAAIKSFMVAISGISIAANQNVSDPDPELPAHMIACSSGEFRRLVNDHSGCLKLQFGPTAVDDLKGEHNTLICRFSENPEMKKRIQNITDLEEAWGIVNEYGPLPILSAFGCGFASRAPGSHTVEGGFSNMKRAKNAGRGCMANLTLDCLLQSLQYFDIAALTKRTFG